MLDDYGDLKLTFKTSCSSKMEIFEGIDAVR